MDEGLLEARYADADRDLHGDPESPVRACPGRAGTSASMLDCDDTDPTINGPQTELRDGEDNDCDDAIDEVPVAITLYPDADGDGYGDPSGATITSDAPVDGYAALPIDCDDGDAARSPVAAEQCDGVDNDCDGEAGLVLGVNDWEDDDGDGVADAACGGADCDDTDSSAYAGAAERCDDLRDNDCDGTVDEGCAPSAPGGRCAGVPPSDPSGSGAVLSDGTPAIAVADGVAFLPEDRLAVALTTYDNLCGHFTAGLAPAGERLLIITLSPDFDAPGLPPTGTYPFVPDSERGSSVVFEGAHLFTNTDAGSGACGPLPDTEEDLSATGSLTITTVTASRVEGSFTFDPGASGPTLTGTFSVPVVSDCTPAEGGTACCDAS